MLFFFRIMSLFSTFYPLSCTPQPSVGTCMWCSCLWQPLVLWWTTCSWMVFNASFNSISVISQWQLILFMSFLGFTSTRLGLWSVLPKDTPTKKTQRIQCSSNPGPLDYAWKTFNTEPCRTPSLINPLPNDNSLDVTNLKAFADDKIKLRVRISLFDGVENTVGKGENAGTSIFSYSHSVF